MFGLVAGGAGCYGGARDGVPHRAADDIIMWGRAGVHQTVPVPELDPDPAGGQRGSRDLSGSHDLSGPAVPRETLRHVILEY